ncbi:ABC transporter ATP-binding protein [Empedobacter brevis]|uniref:ABC transporter ATP-binding protein n=1 Tax=Empedobacter brevis NBRC 14943 = ATCC 43319 TaxID=1218108 RepID=A0A511NFN2_9FLAO|nr:ABC transporter ATP-binding protein [Empedobacter brevis]GEM51298.1 ABC transporter ATP-binding protein [Empedobacter brevis NBRC 14943 = ATCC 43319]
MIEIEKLYKKYKNSDVFALEDFTLTIKQNEIHGLLGPNGAGKTTLMSILSGLIKSTSGNVVIQNFNQKTDLKKIQKIIGIVPQEYALYPTLTARENLEFFGKIYKVSSKELHDKINDLTEKIGMSKFLDKKIDSFSGGMKRRINLLAGILHQPEILFLDEPTVGVDIQSKIILLDYLQELHQQGMSIVYTSHHMAEAEDFCTQVTIMNQGKSIITAEPKELILQFGVHNLEEAFVHLTKLS